MLDVNLKLFSYKNLFDHFVELDRNSRLPSRILINGQSGIGKSTFAFHFINYLLSKKEEAKYDLEKNEINCESNCFNLVNKLSHPNFFYISKNKEKKYIEIDQIRSMISFLNKSSFNNERKIILIDSAEDLNINSSNALLKSLEEASNQNLLILTHNINKKILDTIKSRCLNYKLNFDYSQLPYVISSLFETNLFQFLNDDFKEIIISPKFIINHILYLQENNIDLNSLNIKETIQHIIDNKSYKKNDFIKNNFQSYIEIFFLKMYSETKESKYYDFFLKTITENNLINKFNLDLDSFFVKFEKKYLNI